MARTCCVICQVLDEAECVAKFIYEETAESESTVIISFINQVIKKSFKFSYDKHLSICAEGDDLSRVCPEIFSKPVSFSRLSFTAVAARSRYRP